ncbi:MAG: hypothetical protein COB14_05465 [Alphaproteobacteria bacterium]|nr:MAG: hypothetical protein COB14_05465 [Alphaproteobacteria bacterium]
MADKEHIIPLKDIEAPPPEGKKKMNDLPLFILILLGLGIFFMSPIPHYLKSLIPETFMKSVFSDAYQDVVLDENPERLKEPKKYEQATPLPVLGRGTGVCFSFNSTIAAENKSAIDKKRLESAKYGEIIAEIIAVSMDKTEYILDNVTLNETENKSVICQTFSRQDSLYPNQVKAIYVRPLRPFTPSTITWATAKDIY